MIFIYLFLSLINATKSNNKQKSDLNTGNFNNKINKLTHKNTMKRKSEDKIPMFLDNNNTDNIDQNIKSGEENKNMTFFQRIAKAIYIIFIVFLVVAIIFAIVYIIIVKGGIKTNLSRHLNKIGISIGTDNGDSSNELDIKAILGEVRTSDSESMPMDENEDGEGLGNDNKHTDTENVQNKEDIQNINENS